MLTRSALGMRLVIFSHLSVRRQCDVLIVSIAAVLYHQNWCILHGAHQEHISAQVEIINGNDGKCAPVMHYNIT